MVYRAPAWRVLTTALPSCTPLHQLELDQVGPLYECQQIRSYKSTAVILFTEKKSDTVSQCFSCSLFPSTSLHPPGVHPGHDGYRGHGRLPGALLLLGHQRDGRGALHRAGGDLPHEEEWGRGAVRCLEYDRGELIILSYHVSSSCVT